MEFIWAGDRTKKNVRLVFELTLEKLCDRLTVYAADYYRVFVDGKFVEYGPDRTAAGYARKKTLPLNGAKKIEIEVAGYNVPCYSCDFQSPFFGAEISYNGECVYTAKDFVCKKKGWFVGDVPRFSGQRGFIEVCDFRNKTEETLVPYAVEAPKLLDAVGSVCGYPHYAFQRISEGAFRGFDGVTVPEFTTRTTPEYTVSKQGFDVDRDFLNETQKGGFREVNFALKTEKTGFLRLQIQAKEEIAVFAVFEEYLIDGKWTFRRSGCNDLFALKTPKGSRVVQSFEPYAFKHLKIVYKGEAEIEPSLVGLENGEADFVTFEGDGAFESVFNAAKNTFCQNATDIFMDCPGRERAGWLCDSYFLGFSEALFTGSNKIERAFLENILLGEWSEIPQAMLPKCFPSEHQNKVYIPNWAMWFVIELCAYWRRTGDRELVEKAKGKAYRLVGFFDTYANEYGLLEDLPSWVFVEWSISNSAEYLKGVNFPSNILFMAMLERLNEMYGDEQIKLRADKLRAQILRLSFDGEYFADNAVRVDGKLVRADDHISETCQYYALFFGLRPNDGYAKKMTENFGPLRPKSYLPQIGRSNMFIGNYLRFFWLCEEGEYARVLKEMLEYFATMARETGTLWEHDSPAASCNHGFASVAAMLVLRCTVGFDTVKNGRVVYLQNTPNETYNVNVEFKKKEK